MVRADYIMYVLRAIARGKEALCNYRAKRGTELDEI